MKPLFPRVTLLVVLAGYGLHALAYSWVTPLLEAPDENAHLANVCHVLDARQLPDSAPVVFAARGHAVFEGHQMPLFYLLGAGASWVTGVRPCTALPMPNDAPRSPEDGLMLFAHPRKAPARLLGDAWGNPAWLVRLVSVLLGGAAVLFTFRAASLLFPGSRWAPVVASAWLALNPQFAFIAGTASNDTGAAALGAVVLWWLMRQARDGDWGPRASALGGALLGLGVLLKASVLLLAVPLAVALWCAERGAPVLRRLRRCGAWLGGLAAVSGGVFLRNAVTRGDPTLWRLQLEKLPALVAGAPPDAAYWSGVFAERTFESAWGLFGWMNLPLAPALYRFAGALTLAAGVSALAWTAHVASASWRAAPTSVPPRAPLWLGTLWLGVAAVFFGLLAYNVTFRQPQGRLLFPALGWGALLVAGGVATARASAGGRRLEAGVASGLLLGLGLFAGLALEHYVTLLAFVLR